MIDVTIHTANISFLKEALQSNCKKIRYGSEFCMYAIPSMNELKRAYDMTKEAEKKFVYVTPRLADDPMDLVKKQLQFLDELGETTVIVNDLGALNYVEELSNIKPHLGRQLVYTPSRCPWDEITEHQVNFFTKRKVEKIFYQTALNYEPTINFFKDLKVVGADVDWIPKLFSNLRYISHNNLNVSVHLLSIPVAITRKCHMARFLGEKDFDRCSRPCYSKAYFMNNPTLEKKLYVQGNTIYRLEEPNPKTMESLKKSGVSELVLSMGPLSKMTSQSSLDEVIQKIQT